MFSEIRQAILPLALRNLARRDDLARASLLISSLAAHWRDSRPLQLLIVSPARNVRQLRVELPRFPNIEVLVRPESDFFSTFSPFWMMTGWYRQQVIKLHVPAVLGFGGYLTLDSDICCVGDFDATTFIQDRRALSRWEPKSHHAWWRAVSEMIGTPYESGSHGLSVTPNVLHGKLAAQTLGYFSEKGTDPLSSLGLRAFRKLGSIAWTEYSLYTAIGEHNKNLFEYHVHWDPCYFSETQLFSDQSCVWNADDFERLAGSSTRPDPGATFIIVQSNAHIPIELVREYCLSFAR
jgi:hypothetical protein